MLMSCFALCEISCLVGSGNSPDKAENAGIGAEVGSIIGQVIPIPGLSQLGSFIGGLFGPSQHFAPSGLTYDDDMHAFMESYFSMISTTNQVRSAMGLPPVQPLPFVGEYTPTPNYSGNIGAHNAPYFGPYLAKLLNQPSFASRISESDEAYFEQQGVLDAARAMQDQISQRLQFVLESLQVGTLTVTNGHLTDPNGTSATDANSWAGVQAQSQNAAATSAGMASFLSANGGYILGGIAVLGIIVLLKKRAG